LVLGFHSIRVVLGRLKQKPFSFFELPAGVAQLGNLGPHAPNWAGEAVARAIGFGVRGSAGRDNIGYLRA
jgi:hypothetical protein